MPQGPVRTSLALDSNPAHLLGAGAGLPVLAVAVGSLPRGLSTPNIREMAPSLPIAESA